MQAVGERLARHRIGQQMTQAMLARESGLSKRTVERIEAGASTQFSSLVRVLRVLGLLDGLAQLVPPADASPLDLLHLRGKQRQRASSKARPETPARPWSWNTPEPK